MNETSHTASAGLALHTAGEDAIAQLAALAAADPASPLFGTSNVGVVARAGRLHRRDDEGRSESYAEILTRAGRASVVGAAKTARELIKEHISNTKDLVCAAMRKQVKTVSPYPELK